MKIFQFKREIGLFHSITLGLGALIGAGIFVLLGQSLHIAASNAVFVYIIAAFSAFLSALSYAELSSTYLHTGGEYRYAKEVVNERFAFLLGFLLITGSAVACAVYALGFAAFASVFLPISYPLLAFLIFLLISLLNVFGVKDAARFEFWFTVILSVLLIIFGIMLLSNSSSENFRFRHSWKSIQSIFHGVSVVYISFFGFQVIATSSEETKEPRKTLPRAILLSSVIASGIYLLIVAGVVGVTSNGLTSNPALILEEIAQSLWGRWAALTIVILGLVATITSLNATILAVSRRLYAVAKDRFIPERLSQLHPRFRTPHLAILFLFLVVSPLLFAKSIVWAANISAFAYLFSLMCIHIVLIASRIKHADYERGFKVPFFPIVPILGVFVNMLILFSLDVSILIMGILWTCVGILLFVILKRRERGIQKIKLWYQRLKLFITGRSEQEEEE